jgi:signal transduction histidine kinase
VSILGVGAGCLIFLILMPVASGMIYRIFQPIRQLVSATRRIAEGDLETRVATDRPDEIGMLARSFNEMVKKIGEQREWLQIANAELAEANLDLEAKVRQRTLELESANGRLQSEIAEKEDFLRAVSHDLNAPLRNIGGMAAMLLVKYREKFDEDVVHRLERIRKNVEVETDLIAELLELSRIKTRRQRIERVDVAALVREVGEMFAQDFEQKGIRFAIETPLPDLMAEKARLRQVFQNLVDNAIKYMGEAAEKRITVGHRTCDDGIEFYVSDTGVGIDKDDLGKVFCVFRRGKNTAASVPGKGVGLASVKSIIETYDGRVDVDSEVGKGSRFRFVIPWKSVAAAKSPAVILGGWENGRT